MPLPFSMGSIVAAVCGNTMTNLDPDQAQRFVGPDLGPNYLQRISAEDKVALAWKELKMVLKFKFEVDRPSLNWFNPRL